MLSFDKLSPRLKATREDFGGVHPSPFDEFFLMGKWICLAELDKESSLRQTLALLYICFLINFLNYKFNFLFFFKANIAQYDHDILSLSETSLSLSEKLWNCHIFSSATPKGLHITIANACNYS